MVSSCGSKDDDSTNDPQALIGAWQLESISVNGKEILLPACDRKEVQIYNGTQQQTYDFDTDNTGNCTFEKNTPTNYTVSGNTLKKGEDIYTFSISGNKLTLKYRDKNNNEGVAVFIGFVVSSPLRACSYSFDDTIMAIIVESTYLGSTIWGAVFAIFLMGYGSESSIFYCI